MTAQEVIDVAVKEVGYLEKRSNADLDSKTGSNVGSANYTKYARDYAKWTGINVQGSPWCDCWLDWVFIKAYGVENARKLLGGFSAYTPTSAQYFKNMGRWRKAPAVGDVIFFHNSTRICHTGLVYAVDNKYVYTIEGNTSSADNTVVANGGGVFKKKYVLGNSRISGYGHPAYDNKPVSQEPNGTHIPLNYITHRYYTVMTAGLNVRTKKASDDPDAIPTGEIIGQKMMGDKVVNQATTLVNGKIWMYIGLDAKKREQWLCADNGEIAYII